MIIAIFVQYQNYIIIIMRNFLLYILLFTAIETNSQVLINKAQEWNVLHSYKTIRTRCYNFTQDTLIDGYKYTSLEFSYSEKFDSANSVFSGFVREDDKQVYIRYLDSNEYIIYDFSINQGDTISMGMINHQYPISFRCDTIDSLLICNEYKKRLSMTPLNNSDALPQQWIEGLGSTAGIVEIGEPQYLSFKTSLLCSKINDSLIWKSSQPFCYFTNAPEPERFVLKTGTEKEDFPIKVTTKISYTGLIVKIYDESGDLILIRKIKKEKDLSFEELATGEYTLQLTDAFDRVYALKKIKI
jgi:hypothetical protein